MKEEGGTKVFTKNPKIKQNKNIYGNFIIGAGGFVVVLHH